MGRAVRGGGAAVQCRADVAVLLLRKGGREVLGRGSADRWMWVVVVYLYQGVGGGAQECRIVVMLFPGGVTLGAASRPPRKRRLFKVKWNSSHGCMLEWNSPPPRATDRTKTVCPPPPRSLDSEVSPLSQ